MSKTNIGAKKVTPGKGKVLNSRGYASGLAGGPSGATYAMYPNKGKAAPSKKGNGMAHAVEIAKFHSNRGRV